MPIMTDEDRKGELRGRGGEATFTEGAEKSHVENHQGVLDSLFSRKDKMRSMCETQLGSLFANSGDSYGRARNVGMTAREASGVVNRAFSK